MPDLRRSDAEKAGPEELTFYVGGARSWASSSSCFHSLSFDLRTPWTTEENNHAGAESTCGILALLRFN